MSVSPASTEPSFQFAAVTPSDTAVLTYNGEKKACRALYIGSIAGGTALKVKDDQGTTVEFAGIVAGSILPISTSRVMSTGTTVTSIVALF